MADADLRTRIKEMLVKNLMLQTTADQITDDMPLFGPGGLGLDSIDALELAIEITGKYGFEMRADDENNKRIFSSLRSLTAHIEGHRAN